MSAFVPDPRANIIEKIKACLSRGDAERKPNPHEVETALRMAKKLMSDYNISMADVAFSEANFGSIREEALRARAGIPKWEVQLSSVCNNLFGTKSFMKPVSVKSKTTGNWQDHISVVFYGYDRDIALSVEVYKLLKLEILGMARAFELQEQAAHPDWTPGQVRTRRFAYCDGIVHNLRQRSKQEADQVSAANAAKVRDLVVRKDVEIDNWAKKTHPDLRPVRRHSTGLHDDALNQGSADANKMSLNFGNAVKGKSTGLSLEHKG